MHAGMQTLEAYGVFANDVAPGPSPPPLPPTHLYEYVCKKMTGVGTFQ